MLPSNQRQLYSGNGTASRRETDAPISPQERAGLEGESDRLQGKVALVIGAERENGRFLAVALAKKGSDVVMVCLDEVGDAVTGAKRQIESFGRRCLLIAGNPYDQRFARQILAKTVATFGRLDIFIDYSRPTPAPSNGHNNGQTMADKDVLFPHLDLLAAVLSELTRNE